MRFSHFGDFDFMTISAPSCLRVFAVAFATILAAAALTACGGDVTRVQAFQPSRILALGDQYSVITDTGRKYSISTPDFNCVNYPNWTQSLAANFGMVFAQCNPHQQPATAQLLAQPGAKVADVSVQADQVLAAGLTGTDLISIFVGANDVVAAFADGALDEPARTAQVQAAGRLLATTVNRLVDGGGRVLFVTVPDLGLSPYGRQSADPAQLSRLSTAFNTALRVTVQQDGRFAAIVLADSLIQAATQAPSNYLLSNVTTAACAVATPDCTTSTLVAEANPSTWMWAWGIDFAPSMQSRLATLAIQRAENNPF